MADISEQISKINNAIYGDEVRGSISTALTAMNEQTELINSNIAGYITSHETDLYGTNGTVTNLIKTYAEDAIDDIKEQYDETYVGNVVQTKMNTTLNNMTKSVSYALYSNFTADANETPVLYCDNNTINFYGSVRTNSNITTTGYEYIEIGCIDAAYAPQMGMNILCQSSGMNVWLLSFDRFGRFYISKYGPRSSVDFTDIKGNTYLTFSTTWIKRPNIKKTSKYIIKDAEGVDTEVTCAEYFNSVGTFSDISVRAYMYNNSAVDSTTYQSHLNEPGLTETITFRWQPSANVASMVCELVSAS